MKRAILGILLAYVSVCVIGTSTSAASLKLAPLEYRTTLKSGEKQKGFVDVSNPTEETVRVSTSVQAFKQTTDTGGLEFYSDERVSAGVLLDLDEFNLGPREAVRMYFVLDSTRLPPGDVFGGIFFTTAPTMPRGSGVGQSVRLGTLLSITNGTPGDRRAEIKQLDVSFLQIGETIRGSYSIKNTGSPLKSTGFYPEVTLKSNPFGSEHDHQGKLVFADRTRQNDFEIPAPVFGLYKLSAIYETSTKSTWVLVARPFTFLVGSILFVALGFSMALIRHRKHRSKRL